MNRIELIASIITGVGVLTSGLAIPLMLGRVPPNELYGVRTRAAFASESEWYRINRLGGRWLAVAGVIIAITGGVGFFLPKRVCDAYAWVAAGITLAVIVVPCAVLSRAKPKGSGDGGAG